MNATAVVLKFGSSVLADRHCLPRVVHEIYRYYRRGHHVLAAVSAIGNETDRLLGEARYWSNPPAPEPAVAELLATGERQSAALLCMALERAGVQAGLLSPAGIKLTLSGERLDAWPTSVDTRAIRQAFQLSPVLVLPGFAGVHETGGTALMGRGGTDLTAVFLAQALGAAECRLVKDVDGIYERDPALGVSGIRERRPHRYGRITYEEALRISGKLVQPKAIEYLRDRKYRARVAALLQAEGTEIGGASNSVCDLPAAAPCKVLLLGLGQIGQGVYQRLQSLGEHFEVSGILVRDKHRSRDVAVADGLLTTDVEELLKRPHQLIIDVCSDASIARHAIETGLAAGSPAVTASKRLVAEHGPALTRLAARHGTRIHYAAAVGGAAPMLETLERALEHGPITRLRGVLNGTCNFVIDQLAQGVAFHTAVSQARSRGFAEANVSRDLHGDDSADKLRILARLAFGAESDAVPICREGLSPAESARFGSAQANDAVLRQVATFDPVHGASVKLESLAPDDYLAGASGEENRLIIGGARGREWRVHGKGAGRWPTAEAVIADVLDIRAWLEASASQRSRPSSSVSPRRRRNAASACGNLRPA